MSVELKSTKAKVRDPEKVREVLDSYAMEGVEIQLYQEAQEWVLLMTFEMHDYDWCEWPQALHRDLWPPEDDGPDEDDDDDEIGETAWDKLYEQKGTEGFQALLRDLAPSLETPLVILLLASSEGDCLAHVWSILPASREIAEVQISLD